MEKLQSNVNGVNNAVPLKETDGISRLLSAFLAGRNERTIRAYGADLDDFSQYLGALDIDAASRILLSSLPGDANGMVLGYRSHLVDRELSPATINRRLAALRSLVKLGRTLGVITWALEIPNLKARAYRDTKGPGRPAVRAMMEHCRARGDRKGVRDSALLRILFDLGLRRGEVTGLDLEHIDIEAATVSILGKGRLQRETLSMPGATIDALRAWISERGTEPGPLFLSCDNARKGDGRLSSEGIYKTVRKIGEDVGIRTRPHGLRHTAITEAVKAAQANGYGLEEVTDFSRPLAGFTIISNGETKFTLGANEKKSFAENGISTGSIRVLARHEVLNSDLTFYCSGTRFRRWKRRTRYFHGDS